MKRMQKGFTLIELMIVVAIIGILAAVALPAYQKNVKKAKFTEASTVVQGLQNAVALCMNTLGIATGAGCDNGSNDIPAALGVTGNLTSVTVVGGLITATGDVTALEGKTLTMTPAITNGTLVWTKGGTCIAAGFC